MDFNIYTLGGGATFQTVFNVVAIMMGNGDYTRFLGMGVLVGFITVMARSAGTGKLFDFSWFIYSILLYYASFVPVANVIITDQIDPSESSVVSNVPLGLAAAAGIADEVGWWFASESDTLWSVPDDLSYTKNGMLFGAGLANATMHFEITDPRVAGNFSQFWQQCVFYDLMLGRYTITDLSQSSDMWNNVIKPGTSTARAFAYTDTSGHKSIQICNVGTGLLDADLNTEIPNIISVYGFQNRIEGDRTSAIANFQATMPDAVNYLSGLAESGSQIITQATLSNSLQRGISDWAVRTDASAAAQNYATAMAQVQTRTSYQTAGRLAEQYLPLAQNLIKATIYAMFPLFAVMFLVPGGPRMMLAYGKLLVWIELWAPLFAVIHYFGLSQAAAHGLSAVTLANGTPSLSLSTYTGFASAIADSALFASYAATAVPAIAWGIVWGGGAGLNALASGFLQGFTSSAGQASGEATRGNLSLGNTSFGNASWNQRNEAPMTKDGFITSTRSDGNTEITTTSGQYMQIANSDLPITPQISRQIQSGVQSSATDATRIAQSNAEAFTRSTSSTLSNLDSLNQQVSNTQGYNQSFDRSEASQFQQNYQRVNELTEQFAKENGLTRSQAATVMAMASVGTGVHASGGIEVLGNGATVSTSANASMSIQGQTSDQSAETFRKAQAFAQRENFGESYGKTLDSAARTSAQFAGQTNNSGANQLSADLRKSADLRSTTQASIERSEALQSVRSRMESNGFSFTADQRQAFLNFVGEYSSNGLAGATQLINRANNGNAEAQATLMSFATEFGRSRALSLAGVADAPNNTAELRAAGDQAMAGVRAEGMGGVNRQATSGTTQVEGERKATLRLDTEGVRDETSMLFTQNEAQRGERNRDFVTQVDAATGRANGGGKAGIQYQIDEAQKPGHLAGDTIGRGARNLVGAIPSPLNIEGATGLAESIIDGARGTPSPSPDKPN